MVFRGVARISESRTQGRGRGEAPGASSRLSSTTKGLILRFEARTPGCARERIIESRRTRGYRFPLSVCLYVRGRVSTNTVAAGIPFTARRKREESGGGAVTRRRHSPRRRIRYNEQDTLEFRSSEVERGNEYTIRS